jgi:hypothetical protein
MSGSFFEQNDIYGKVLHFPGGVKRLLDESLSGPKTGLLLSAPSLKFVSNPVDVLPPESWGHGTALCTERSLDPAVGTRFVGKPTRFGVILFWLSELKEVREAEVRESYYQVSRGQGQKKSDKYRALEIKRAKRLEIACEEIRATSLQPCLILFDSSPRWVWVHPEDFTIFE